MRNLKNVKEAINKKEFVMAGLEGIVQNRGQIREVIHHNAILYYLAHNGIDVFHYGQISSVNRLSTGQPNLEVYDNEADLVARALEFGVVVDLEEGV